MSQQPSIDTKLYEIVRGAAHINEGQRFDVPTSHLSGYSDAEIFEAMDDLLEEGEIAQWEWHGNTIHFWIGKKSDERIKAEELLDGLVDEGIITAYHINEANVLMVSPQRAAEHVKVKMVVEEVNGVLNKS